MLTIYSRLSLVFVFLFILASCTKDIKTEVIPEAEFKGILRFWLDASKNPVSLNSNIELEITDSTITGRIPYYTNTKQLVVSYETDPSTKVTSGGGDWKVVPLHLIFLKEQK